MLNLKGVNIILGKQKKYDIPANPSRRVDLPQPEGPIMAKSSPGRA